MLAATLAALACTALAQVTHRSSPQQPAGNLCVIVLDDVGAELIGAYDAYFRSVGRPSGEPARTPAINGLAARRGVTFTRAWSSPWCSPTRASLLTGLHAHRTGLGHALESERARDEPGLDPRLRLLPELLRGAPRPFTSVALGKWHLASRAQLLENPAHPLGSPTGRWFDRFAGSLFNLEKLPSAPPHVSAYCAWTKSYASRVLLSVNPCAPHDPPCSVERSAPPVQAYATVDTADDALAVVSELREPWFLYVAFNGAHAPVHRVPEDVPFGSCGLYASPDACL